MVIESGKGEKKMNDEEGLASFWCDCEGRTKVAAYLSLFVLYLCLVVNKVWGCCEEDGCEESGLGSSPYIGFLSGPLVSPLSRSLARPL